MTTPQTRASNGHQFGGVWTEQKLKVLAGYLKGYTTALRDKPNPHKPFRKAFIDAFAGTGYRGSSDAEDNSTVPQLLFPDFAEQEQDWLDGSARIALKTEPVFNHYIFIEKSPRRCKDLEDLKKEFPEHANRIDVRQGDANKHIQDLCERQWSSHRAVLFLDPYGMQVEWETIKAIASTKAIDLWLLFPLGIGVNRLLKKNGDIPESWRRRLDLLLGTKDWYDEFYNVETTPTLFGNKQECVVKATMQTIGYYFNNRLKDIFVGVAEKPGVLRNSVNSPLYLLCFAVGNYRGKNTALRIANHLLSKIGSL